MEPQKPGRRTERQLHCHCTAICLRDCKRERPAGSVVTLDPLQQDPGQTAATSWLRTKDRACAVIPAAPNFRLGIKKMNHEGLALLPVLLRAPDSVSRWDRQPLKLQMMNRMKTDVFSSSSKKLSFERDPGVGTFTPPLGTGMVPESHLRDQETPLHFS